MTQSCNDVSKLNWRLPKAGSVPSLPERKSTTSTRDSGFGTDTSDYDHPVGSQAIPGTSEIIDAQAPYPLFEKERRKNFSEYAIKIRYYLLSLKAKNEYLFK